jgi:hypothetical protein
MLSLGQKLDGVDADSPARRISRFDPVLHLLYHHLTEAVAARKTWRTAYDALGEHGVTYAVVQERRFLGPRAERGAFFLADEEGRPTQFLAMARDIHPSFEIDELEVKLGTFVAPRDRDADTERDGLLRSSRDTVGTRDAQRVYDARGRGPSRAMLERLNEYTRSEGWDRFHRHSSEVWDRARDAQRDRDPNGPASGVARGLGESTRDL